MKTTRKGFQTSALRILMLFFLLAAGIFFGGEPAKADLLSGTCGAEGNNISWSLTTDGELIISGKGKMENFSLPDPDIVDPKKIAPWTYHVLSKELITKITVKEGITNIGWCAFQELTYIETVSLPSTITEIGDNAFNECKRLKTINLPEAVTKIGYNAFYGCKALTTIKLPSKLTYLGHGAFWNSGLTSLEVPGSVDVIQEYLCYFTPLESLILNEGTTRIEETVINSETVKLVRIPRSVTEIDDRALHIDSPYITMHDPDMIVQVHKYSTGWQYAKENGLKISYTVDSFDSTLTVSGVKSGGYVYTGKAIKPAVKVTFLGNTLEKDTDYTVTYSNNTNVGKATLTIKGIGAFSGTKKISFTIYPKATTLKKVKPLAAGFRVTWNKQAKQVAGYQIQYSTSKKFKSAGSVKQAASKGTSVDITKKIKAKKTYYVRIRTYYKKSGKTYYSTWSKALSVKTK